MTYELRFQDGRVQAIDEQHGLNPDQLAALNQGLARLVALTKRGEVVVLAEAQASGNVMILAGVPKEATRRATE
jgi:hypothetical protein